MLLLCERSLTYFLPFLLLLLDEEIGGSSGMNVFVGLDDFKSLNVGFALDEGMTLGAS